MWSRLSIEAWRAILFSCNVGTEYILTKREIHCYIELTANIFLQYEIYLHKQNYFTPTAYPPHRHICIHFALFPTPNSTKDSFTRVFIHSKCCYRHVTPFCFVISFGIAVRPGLALNFNSLPRFNYNCTFYQQITKLTSLLTKLILLLVGIRSQFAGGFLWLILLSRINIAENAACMLCLQNQFSLLLLWFCSNATCKQQRTQSAVRNVF